MRGSADIDRRIDALVARQRGPMAVAVWAAGAAGRPWYVRDARAAYPAASVIKVAYLVEFFAAHAGGLDAPLPGIDAVLDDARHPALAPFSARQRADIRRALRGASVRRIGAIMMARVGAANHVYNAAANVVTAVLGGPRGLTRRIRARAAAFAPIAVRRYMLAARARGDNTTSAAALGAVVQGLAAARLRGVDGRTARAMQEAVRLRPRRAGGVHRAKSGYLPSAPVVSAFCGWWRRGRRAVVYVVMASAPRPARGPRDPLPATARRIRDLVLRHARTAR